MSKRVKVWLVVQILRKTLCLMLGKTTERMKNNYKKYAHKPAHAPRIPHAQARTHAHTIVRMHTRPRIQNGDFHTFTRSPMIGDIRDGSAVHVLYVRLKVAIKVKIAAPTKK